ncbi:MAG TPA: M15 family metallopeptidase [Gemmatimonadaceae bacterium]|nr:M15 family metallopeptidase [Gemmatimonadaceae bacterium]
MSLWLIRAAALMVSLASCTLLNRPPREPVSTVEVPTAADDAADTLLVDLLRVDSTFIVDLRYATSNNFTGAPLPGYEANRAYLRAEAAAALAVANEDLRAQGYLLKIFDAYRPVRASEAMVAWTERVNRPDLIKNGYIAARSRHNLGVAVDLTLVNLQTRSEITMGTPFDHFSPAAHTKNAHGVILKNRQLLKKVMERQGFTNYEKEWWHYSYAVQNPVRFDKVIR